MSKKQIYTHPNSQDQYTIEKIISATYFGDFCIATKKNEKAFIKVSSDKQINYKEITKFEYFKANRNSYKNTLKPESSFIDQTTGMIVTVYHSSFLPDSNLKTIIQNHHENYLSNLNPIRSIFSQLLNAVESIHKQDKLIKDLSPYHVFVSEEGIVRLASAETEELKVKAQQFQSFDQCEKDAIPEFFSKVGQMIHTKESDSYRLGLILFRLLYNENFLVSDEYKQACQDGKIDDFIQNKMQQFTPLRELEIYREIILNLLKQNPDERVTPSNALDFLNKQKRKMLQSSIQRNRDKQIGDSHQEQLQESEFVEINNKNNHQQQTISEPNYNNNQSQVINKGQNIANTLYQNQSRFLSKKIILLLILPILVSLIIYYLLQYCQNDFCISKQIYLKELLKNAQSK